MTNDEIKEDLKEKLSPPLPPGTDPSKELDNKRYEKMAQMVARGMKQADAYVATSNSVVTRKTAKEGASKIFKRPECRARLVWLKTVTKGQKTVTSGKTHDLTTKEGIAAKLQEVIRASDSRNPEVIQALKELASLLGIKGPDPSVGTEVDPGVIGAWMTRVELEGRDPREVLKEGGIREVGLAWCAVLGVEPAQLVAAITAPTSDSTHAPPAEDELENIKENAHDSSDPEVGHGP